MNAKREAPLSLDSNPGAPQLRRATTKRSTRHTHLLSDSLIVTGTVAAATAAIVAAGMLADALPAAVVAIVSYSVIGALAIGVALRDGRRP
jgi:hypothetical protein